MKILMWIKSLFRHRHYWTVVRTTWPYPYGWGTYCKGCNTLLDTGLTKEHATRVAAEENAIARRRRT